MMFKKQSTLRVNGAGHFLISTHPRECADAIDQFIYFLIKVIIKRISVNDLPL